MPRSKRILILGRIDCETKRPVVRMVFTAGILVKVVARLDVEIHVSCQNVLLNESQKQWKFNEKLKIGLLY